MDKAHLPFATDFIEQLEAEYIFRTLVPLPHAMLEDGCFMDLPIMPPRSLLQNNLFCRPRKRMSADAASVYRMVFL